MVSIISIGVSNYKKLSPIKCAHSDAKKVYNAFEYTLNTNFSHFNSLCVFDIHAYNFEKLIEILEISFSENDALIVYFSGHGEIIDDEFFFCFSNDDEKKRKLGKVSLNRTSELFRELKAKVILIIDSCHSGAALGLSKSKYIFKRSNISVITSTESYRESEYDLEGSKFTNVFCTALKNLYEEQQKISLLNIVKNIKELGYSDVLISVQEGLDDVEIGENTTVTLNKNFSEDFIKKAISSTQSIREMLWYQANGIPSSIKYEILENYLDLKLSDPSWLVRRSIGTFVNSIPENDKKYHIIKKYLLSPNWMTNCIGLIGGRYSLHIDEIKELYLKHLRRDKHVDSIWLANLYLIDNKYYDLEVLLSSRLSRTSWGILDIWQRLIKHQKNAKDIIIKIKSVIKDKNLLIDLYNHIWFENIYFDELKNEFDNSLLLNNVKKCKLIEFLYKKEKRGLIVDSRTKWLYSLLYGNWRDQLSLDFEDYIDCFKESLLLNELKLLEKLPSVEMRMAIFQFFSQYKDKYIDFYNSLQWGLKDKHPWVRRVALDFFKKDDINKLSLNDEFDTNLYPGLFDFILKANSIGVNIADYLPKYTFTRKENQSLEYYLGNIEISPQSSNKGRK